MASEKLKAVEEAGGDAWEKVKDTRGIPGTPYLILITHKTPFIRRREMK